MLQNKSFEPNEQIWPGYNSNNDNSGFLFI